MGISAGCDSRKSLAAAKEVKSKIYFFTHTPTPSKEVDMEVPARLLPRLGIEHHRVDLEAMDEGFQEYYRCSAT
jgi:7-cyano-7-deazaguanine synthase in queuosine biosynthesis